MLTSVYKMKQVLAFVDKINQVAEGDVGSGNAGLSFSSSLCMTLARWIFWHELSQMSKIKMNVFACKLS